MAEDNSHENGTEIETELDERQVARKDLLKILLRSRQLIHSLAVDTSTVKASEIKKLATEDEKTAKELLNVAMKKKKKREATGSKNLTNACIVAPAFAKFVASLKKSGALGNVKGEALSALDAIINKNISSLLVNTLLLSASNYQQPKKEGVIFCVTDAMKTHLGPFIKIVSAQRAALHAKNATKKPFNPDNYDSALNNVLAASVREKDASTSRRAELDDETLNRNLAALQAHLKAHNASLRKTRE